MKESGCSQNSFPSIADKHGFNFRELIFQFTVLLPNLQIFIIQFDQSNYYIGVATYEGNIRDTYQLAFKFAIKNAVEGMRNQDTIDKYYVKRFFYDRINGNFECHVIKTKEKI